MLFAPHYALPHPCRVEAASVPLSGAADGSATAVSQLKQGEGFAVLDVTGGWAWGYGLHDHYVGYLPVAALGAIEAEANHVVTAPLAPVFAGPAIKTAVVTSLPIGARLCGEAEGAFLKVAQGYLHLRHVAAVDEVSPDPVAVAERLIGAPYLWGGRGAGGIDCSGLVQVALGLSGILAPRDSDQQRGLGREIAEGDALRRGDIIFFPGHVGLMADGARLLHANAFWMATVIEPLADVIARLEEAGETRPIVARRRID